MNTPLIQQARATDCTQWASILKLIDQSSDPAEREQLHCIMSSKYHQEEYEAGAL